MNKKKIAVIGAGNMGTAMAELLAKNGHRVNIWDIDERILKEIALRHKNQRYLPGIKLHKNIIAKPSHVECIKGADMVLLAVPSKSIHQVIKKIKPLLSPKMIILSVTKGIDKKTLKTSAEKVLQELPHRLKNNFANMTGPAVAHELAQQAPTAVEVASPSIATAKKVEAILENKFFKVFVTKDMRGAAISASLKNVYAILFGIAQDLGWTLNTKSTLFTLALQEMKIVLRGLRADPKTALSLSGLGDLTVTSFNPKSRNVQYGRLIAKRGVKTPDALGMKQTAEGYYATPLIARLCRKKKINAPLIVLTNDILKKKKRPRTGLMNFIKNI